MRLRRFKRVNVKDEDEPRGFDSFDLRLGDLMRGERATLGKSLLDVERELRIKANYVAAIENADPDAFDTPGFIPGYVRSYARYLNMDPDTAFAGFCAESGFSTAHGMSAEASSSSMRKSSDPISRASTKRGDDRLVAPNTPFIPARESIFAKVEPGAIGSVAVLIALISAIGYGGWSVLNEVQRVQVAPVENTPNVLAELDPLDGAGRAQGDAVALAGNFAAPEDDTLDRLYRPQALDVPVLVARDAPISTLDPARVGALSPTVPVVVADNTAIENAIASVVSPQVVAEHVPGVKMVAVRPAWVRVRSADGSVIFEGTMNAGETYDVPVTENPATLLAGASGAIYFRINGQHYGPVGQRGTVTKNLALTSEHLAENLQVADMTRDTDYRRYAESLQTQE